MVDQGQQQVVVDLQADPAQTLGVGFYTRAASSAGLRLNQTLYAPFGDVPLLVLATQVTNGAAATASNLAVAVNFGGQFRQFAMPGFGAQCAHSFVNVSLPAGAAGPARGLLHMTHPPAGTPPPPGPAPGRWLTNGQLNDPNPRPTFLVVSGGAAPINFGTSGTRLFPGGQPTPHFPLDHSLATSGPEAVLTVAQPLAPLAPGQVQFNEKGEMEKRRRRRRRRKKRKKEKRRKEREKEKE